MTAVRPINCATLRPVGGGLASPRRIGCRCLLVECDAGLVLVDAGLGTQDLQHPVGRIGRRLAWTLRPRRERAQTALAQIEALGLDPAEVRHIVLTHLDPDHVGGIGDFPEATIHVALDEMEAALEPRTDSEHRRYRPIQWAHGPDFRLYPAEEGDTWQQFERCKRLEGLPPELLLVPLPGHTRGHCGVAVHAPGGWWLHAGDAFTQRRELTHGQRAAPAIRLFHRLVDEDRALQRATLVRLQHLALRAADRIQIVSAHDGLGGR